MSSQTDTHSGLHSEFGALPGEHPGRAANPIVKIQDLAWLEFEKPDLRRAEAFACAFGFTVSLRTDDELHLRGTLAGSPCVILRKGTKSRFVGAAYLAADASDVLRLAEAVDRPVVPLRESLGGIGVDLTDPSNAIVRVVSDMHQLPAIANHTARQYNFGKAPTRYNSTQRPPREPATVERLGHLVVQSSRYLETMNWYLEHLGLIVSDFLFYSDHRERGPVMSFMRCDRGEIPSDHHTLAMTLGPVNRYVHSAYQVCDLDVLAAGGAYLLDQGYQRSWGIGRHVQGSQIFDYWRDPDGFMVEHFSDGDLFDCTLEPGWAPMSASGLAQWGPPVTKDFLGLSPRRESLHELTGMFSALRHDNEFDLQRLRGLLKVAST